MKAVVCEKAGGPEVLKIQDVSTPMIGDHQVLVRTKATALNRADTLQRQGKYPPPPGASPILGLELSGVIEQVGSKVNPNRIGQRICALLTGGGYAEFAAVDEALLIPIPDSMSFEDAAGIPEVFLTAYQALVYLGQLKSGELALIHAGASGVGTAAIQLAKKIGAEVHVTASLTKHPLCKSLGASRCIDYKNEQFDEVILELTNGKGVNFILDFLGASYLQKNIDTLDFDGRMVMLATMGGMNVVDLNMGKIVWKRLKLMGSTLRARPLQYKAKLNQDFLKDYWGCFESGELEPIIDSVFDINDVQRAHERMDANLNAGKIILKFSDHV